MNEDEFEEASEVTLAHWSPRDSDLCLNNNFRFLADHADLLHDHMKKYLWQIRHYMSELRFHLDKCKEASLHNK